MRLFRSSSSPPVLSASVHAHAREQILLVCGFGESLLVFVVGILVLGQVVLYRLDAFYEQLDLALLMSVLRDFDYVLELVGIGL